MRLEGKVREDGEYEKVPSEVRGSPCLTYIPSQPRVVSTNARLDIVPPPCRLPSSSLDLHEAAYISPDFISDLQPAVLQEACPTVFRSRCCPEY